MELLQYKYHNAYAIQANSTDIGLSWWNLDNNRKCTCEPYLFY